MAKYNVRCRVCGRVVPNDQAWGTICKKCLEERKKKRGDRKFHTEYHIQIKKE